MEIWLNILQILHKILERERALHLHTFYKRFRNVFHCFRGVRLASVSLLYTIQYMHAMLLQLI